MPTKIVFGLLTLFVIVVRLWSLQAYPLTDTTEARYSDIARVMVETGNWITPQVTDGHPFWAKPPLSFWQGAISMKLFGLSEFSARLPSMINFLLILLLVYVAAASRVKDAAPIAIFVAVTALLGFVVSGGVMTDIAMTVGTTLCMVAFWRAMFNNSTAWGYAFFLGLTIGMLAKGPVAWILSLGPIILWTLVYRQTRNVITKLPMLEGLALVGLTAIPWFLLAELETPGFLEYFFIGEHLQRYLVSGWQADLYGNAHDEPLGTIWLFTLYAFFPWSLFIVWNLMTAIAKKKSSVRHCWPTHNDKLGYTTYLLMWALWPSVFFTFAGNILPTYVLTALPAFSVLTAGVICQKKQQTVVFTIFALVVPLAMIAAQPLGLIDRLEARSQFSIIQFSRQKWPDAKIIYVGGRPHSARYYSGGQAALVQSQSELLESLSDIRRAIILVKNNTSISLENFPLKPIENISSKGYSAFYLDTKFDSEVTQ